MVVAIPLRGRAEIHQKQVCPLDRLQGVLGLRLIDLQHGGAQRGAEALQDGRAKQERLHRLRLLLQRDHETNPAEGIDAGQVVCQVGVAPVKPAEFVIFQLSQFSGGVSLVNE